MLPMSVSSADTSVFRTQTEYMGIATAASIAMIAMIAITTISSTSENPFLFLFIRYHHLLYNKSLDINQAAVLLIL